MTDKKHDASCSGMHRRFPGEIEDLELVREVGRNWGYGNCIQYLKHAWAKVLTEKYGMTPEDAARAALMHEEEIKAFVEGWRLLKEDVI